MNLEVVAESPEDFEKWKDAQRVPAPGPASPATELGHKLFIDRCAGCHAIRGTDAVAEHGPHLTHLNSRRRLADAPQYAGKSMDWITGAQRIKPGARMPSIALSETEKLALSSYLATLD